MKVDPNLIETGVSAWITSAGVRNPSQQMKGDAASVVTTILAAVIPAIQNAALERAAVVAQRFGTMPHGALQTEPWAVQQQAADEIAAVIRALKEGT